MLNDVVHKISDGLMGFGNSNGTGVHIKIGASAVQSLEPITMTVQCILRHCGTG